MVNNISDYGIKIVNRLTELRKPQKWLIESVREKTGLFFDSSYMHKILIGKAPSKTIINAINEILDLKENE